MKTTNQTIVVIAHRLSTIRQANKILVIKKGEIIEQGSHDELVALKGGYHQLVERQLGNRKDSDSSHGDEKSTV